MCFSSTIHGRRLLSFACPKESNQRKGHPRVRGLRASMPADYASRLRASPRAHPCAEVELAGILPAIASRLILRLLAAAERGPGRAERGSPCRRSFLLLLFGFPLSSGEGRTDQPREARAARGIAPIRTTGHGWPVGRTRPPVANPRRSRGRGSEGAVFFGYFLLGKQKKVTGDHGWSTNHTRT